MGLRVLFLDMETGVYAIICLLNIALAIHSKIIIEEDKKKGRNKANAKGTYYGAITAAIFFFLCMIGAF